MAELAAASSLAMVYSTSLLYAGFIGLGALWATSPIYYGGRGGRGYPGGFRGRYPGGFGRGRHHGFRGGGYRGRGRPGHHFHPRSGYEFEPPDLNGLDSGFAKRTLEEAGSPIISSTFEKQANTNKEITNFGIGLTDKSPRTDQKSKQIYSSENHDSHKMTKRQKRNTLSSYRLRSRESNRLNVLVPQKYNKEERILFSIRQRDTHNCGLRLVCELAAVRHRPLEWEEWEILKFVYHGDTLFEALYPGESVRPGSAALRDYREAALFGETAGACADRFSTCSSTAHEMMAMITSIVRSPR